MTHGTSNVWVSELMREHDRYKRFLKQLQHVAPKSPFLPTNFREWLELREAILEQKAADEKRKSNQAESVEATNTGGGKEKVKRKPAFDGKEFIDSRSSVLARQSIWALSAPDEPVRSHTPWPTFLVFKQNGAYRAKCGQHRIFPSPRMDATPSVGWEERRLIAPFPFDDINQNQNAYSVERISDGEILLALELSGEVDR